MMMRHSKLGSVAYQAEVAAMPTADAKSNHFVFSFSERIPLGKKQTTYAVPYTDPKMPIWVSVRESASIIWS